MSLTRPVLGSISVFSTPFDSIKLEVRKLKVTAIDLSRLVYVAIGLVRVIVCRGFMFLYEDMIQH